MVVVECSLGNSCAHNGCAARSELREAKVDNAIVLLVTTISIGPKHVYWNKP